MIQRYARLPGFLLDVQVLLASIPVCTQCADILVGISVCPDFLAHSAHLKNRIIVLWVI